MAGTLWPREAAGHHPTGGLLGDLVRIAAAVLPRVRHHEGPAENRRSDSPHSALARPTVGRRQTVSATRWYQAEAAMCCQAVRRISTPGWSLRSRSRATPCRAGALRYDVLTVGRGTRPRTKGFRVLR